MKSGGIMGDLAIQRWRKEVLFGGGQILTVAREMFRDTPI